MEFGDEGAVGALIFLWMWRRNGSFVTYFGLRKTKLNTFPEK